MCILTSFAVWYSPSSVVPIPTPVKHSLTYRDTPSTYRDTPPTYRDTPPTYRDTPPTYRDTPRPTAILSSCNACSPAMTAAPIEKDYGWTEPKRPFGKALRYFHSLAIVKADITWEDLVTPTGRHGPGRGHQHTTVDKMQAVAASCQLITEGTKVIVAVAIEDAVASEDDKTRHSTQSRTTFTTNKTSSGKIMKTKSSKAVASSIAAAFTSGMRNGNLNVGNVNAFASTKTDTPAPAPALAPVVVFWKQGLHHLWGENKWLQQLEPQVSNAISQLGTTYPPPAPKKRDSRHQAYASEVARFGEGNCGVYHFAR